MVQARALGPEVLYILAHYLVLLLQELQLFLHLSQVVLLNGLLIGQSRYLLL